MRVSVGKTKPFVLKEEPTVVLSNTWFGDPMGGELCYALRTSARRSFDTLRKRPNRAICSVLIKNAFSTPLDFQRLCIKEGFETTRRLFLSRRGPAELLPNLLAEIAIFVLTKKRN